MVVSLFHGIISPSACSAATFSYPIIPDIKFLSLEANLVDNFNQNVPVGGYPNHGAVNVTGARFCNVSTIYTHPGGNDAVNVQVWLPTDTWNGRLQGIGGSGWTGGLPGPALPGMAAAVSEGYSAYATDAGLGLSADPITPVSWALPEEGKPNMRLLQNLASDSLYEGALIAKNFTAAFYAKPAAYSYFSGCSQGGRQGLMLAQRYPDVFDGIAAGAPGINWNPFVVGAIYPDFLMTLYGSYPPSCEVDFLTAAAIEACDGLDGVVDGIISDPEACGFDPLELVGTIVECPDFVTDSHGTQGGENLVKQKRRISKSTATIWDGPRRANYSRMWYGPYPDAVLSKGASGITPIGTICSADGTCTMDPITLFQEWIRLFVLKNSTSDTGHLTLAEYENIFDTAALEYDSVIGTADPDLSAFRRAGGKMITYHGLADPLIPPRGTAQYYKQVTALDPKVHDFYRLFFAPGLGHCHGGSGPFPDTTFDTLVRWVEDGVAPETLAATSVGTGPVIKRPLCAYPLKQEYTGRTGEFTCE
ncbi:Tannase/feruloyl esterase [Chaetomium tenue]|uniref:Tannase/feruloyl esterase n=1 Tax=Chaetomium tenue TaxID=1854479 RepID=A0ACB7P8Z4_9PEZI|nr:Tannase/feruloyl esterase [Chaetomium globosum]